MATRYYFFRGTDYDSALMKEMFGICPMRLKLQALRVIAGHWHR